MPRQCHLPNMSVGDLHELGSASNPLKAQCFSRPLPPAVLPPWEGRGLQAAGTPKIPTVSLCQPAATLLLWGRGPGWEKERQNRSPRLAA